MPNVMISGSGTEGTGWTVRIRTTQWEVLDLTATGKSEVADT